MEHHCPICGNPLSRHEIVCLTCRDRIEAREPIRRAGVLRAWAQALMLFFAIFLFLKGAYAALSPRAYERFVSTMGFPTRDPAAHHWNAAFALVAALLYAIAWSGGYLGRRWSTLVCFGALVAFVIGQGVSQFVLGHEDGGLAGAVALFVFWVSVPVFQFLALVLGRGGREGDASGRGREPGQG